MSTVTKTPPKFPDDFRALLDRISRNAAETDGDDAKVGALLREPAHQPDVAAFQPDLARPRLDAMAGSALGEIRPSLGKRDSRRLVRSSRPPPSLKKLRMRPLTALSPRSWSSVRRFIRYSTRHSANGPSWSNPTFARRRSRMCNI